MKHIYSRNSGGAEGPEDSNFSAYMHDDGALMVKVPFDGMAPFLAEGHVLDFLDAVRRVYADRYDRKHKTVRCGTIKETPDGKHYSNSSR